jgi:glycosyltransferase involved in cell wall biosynthesis
MRYRRRSTAQTSRQGTVSAVRIALVVPRGEQPSSGVLTVVAELAGAVARRGHAVELWRLHDWTTERYRPVRERFEETGVLEVGDLSRTRLRRLRGAAARLARERSIDVVHLHGGFNPSNTAVSARLPVPFVFSPHSAYDPVSLRRSRMRKRIYASLFERPMLRRAARVVALTEPEAAAISAFAPGAEIAVIPNGVAPVGDVDRAAFRRELGLTAERPLAVFVGRLDVARKGLDRVVVALAGAPRWTAALVGPDFRDVDALRRQAGGAGVAERLRLVGERAPRDVVAADAAADVFVLLSRWEGLPMALLEALAVGTPALVSPAVEAAVPVGGAGAGWVAADGDAASVLRAIERMSDAERAERRAAAAALASRYDWASVGERFESVYERAIGARDRVGP